MIATLITIGIAFYWMLRETDYLRIRLPMGKDNALIVEVENIAIEPQAVKLLTASKPILALPIPDPDNYPMTLTTDIKTLKAMIDQLSKTELELTEEVWGYDYSDQT